MAHALHLVGRAELAEDQADQRAAEEKLARERGPAGGEELCPHAAVQHGAEQAVAGAVAHRRQPGAEPHPGETAVQAERVLGVGAPAEIERQPGQRGAFQNGQQAVRLRVRTPDAQGAQQAQPGRGPSRLALARDAGTQAGDAAHGDGWVRAVRAWLRAWPARRPRADRAAGRRSAPGRPRPALGSPSPIGRPWPTTPPGRCACR
ncbi:hypothetical protein GALL_435380 [mine drainage metagenome]|uniref:Uncharacterized protein n=1 Tax=mine drainage metagenome TaxID=410659 RepID=A0A1J5PT63_9ZZZZ